MEIYVIVYYPLRMQSATVFYTFNYLKLVEDKLHAGSVIIADNAGSSSRAMGDYLDHVRSSGLYTSEFIPGGWDGVEISVKL